MKEKNFKIVIISSALAIAALISAQIYWITNAISVEEREFTRKANYALMNAAEKAERREMAEVFKTVIKREFPNDTTLNNLPFFNGKFRRRFENVDEPARMHMEPPDSLRSPFNGDIEHGGDLGSGKRKSIRLFGQILDTVYLKKTEMISRVMDEFLVAVSNTPIEERIKKLELDSALYEELENFNIDAEYYFGVYKGKPLKLITSKDGSDPGQLINSDFRVPLFPFDIFGEPNFLVVYFPEQQVYAVKSIAGTLAISAVLIFIVIGVFSLLVNAALKQKKMAEVKNDLINNITHEFKTPISAISLALEVLAEPTFNLDKASSDRYLGAIKDENKKLKRMVENLLNAAAMEKGEQKLDKVKLDMKELVYKAAGPHINAAEKKKGVFTIKTEGNDFTVEADSFHVSNAVSNLMDNAVKYSGEKPIINVLVIDEGAGVSVSVKDNGIGINKKDIKKIFDAFYRAQRGNVHNVKGYGIGLSYAKQTAEEHGGSIKVSSKPGEGSLFELYLPKLNGSKWKIK